MNVQDQSLKLFRWMLSNITQLINTDKKTLCCVFYVTDFMLNEWTGFAYSNEVKAFYDRSCHVVIGYSSSPQLVINSVVEISFSFFVVTVQQW